MTDTPLEHFTFNDFGNTQPPMPGAEIGARPGEHAEPELRLVIRGRAGHEPTIHVEIQLGPDWIARHEIRRENGVWMVSAAKAYLPRSPTPSRLTARLKKKATVHRHLPRIERLLNEALALDDRLQTDAARRPLLDRSDQTDPWWDRLVQDWDMSKLRSPRGRAPAINPRVIERMLEEGLTYREIGKRLGVHRQSVCRAISTDRKRRNL